jgi:hypothetical protein
MRVRPLELWVFSLLFAIAGVVFLHQEIARERAKEPNAPYSMTVKAPRPTHP